MDWTSISKFLQEKAASIGLQIAGALVLYVAGRWLISMVVHAVQRVLTRQKIEPTVMRFVGNTLSVALNVTLVVAILGYFGVQTTTFAALIAAMGLWERLSPGGAPRKGVLGIVTYRGNRLFVSLLGAGFIHLIWIAATSASLWGALALSVAFAVAVFVFV